MRRTEMWSASCLGNTREASGARLRGLREVSGRRPGGTREASGRRPGGAREASIFVIFGSCWRPAVCELKKTAKPCEAVRFFRHELSNSHEFLTIFAAMRFLTAGAMVLHDFTKTPLLCRKFKNAAPVHKKWRRSEQKCAFRSSFESELCVFAVPVQ